MFVIRVKEVKETGILIENIAAVTESVGKATSTSIYCRFQQLNISDTSLRRILHKDLWYDVIQSAIGSGVEAN